MSNIAPDDPRVKLAEDRTVLAAERTYASWLRTGLAFLGVGLAAQRFLREVLPAWPLRVLALALFACALACFVAAAWRDGAIRTRLNQAQIHLMPRALTLGVAILLIAISGLAAIVLWWP
ncbi:DUF202 domain-containing protein [Methylobacterium brachythecii]|uniref:Putative membrane protein n=1 Tax=Methylobacterium brachythecii TaxID=1176177 RepID=A0A7W6F5J0_9HYPH|nr:DUF202 domain-containing protein [Methylobacterium brachythecii]MBB3901309.1 putative membrane protein [Methylobacterium brachythecii]GLS45686.1 hypothetical protein GCM10007884_36770 [Methylobacterium brachythecii]